jgi:hypothetical protein
MKKLFTSYTTFTRTEHTGLFCLCGLLILLLIIRATMSLWVHPSMNKGEEQQLVKAWESFKRTQPHKYDTAKIPVKDFQDAGDDQPTVLPDTIDINTADSATLVRLKGIGPVTAGKMVNRRKIKGPFTNISQLSETGAFSKEQLALLKKHLVFGSSTKN